VVAAIDRLLDERDDPFNPGLLVVLGEELIGQPGKPSALCRAGSSMDNGLPIHTVGPDSRLIGSA
jgi:hypothetical protein